jgi:hydroxypyruvate reductase
LNPKHFLSALYDAAVAAVDPERLVLEALGRRSGALVVRSLADPGRREFVFVPDRVVVLALGKAAVRMAHGASQALGSRVDAALVVAPPGSSRGNLPSGYRLLEAGHPLSDERSLAAGEACLSLASSLRSRDLILVLLSGGSSSLAAAVRPEIGLDDKVRTVSLLAAAGASLTEIHVVRGALSRLKAGRLAAASGAASVVTLVLSDAADDGWHLVGGGPTLGLPPVGREPLAILDRYRLVPLIPQSVRSTLAGPRAEAATPTSGNRWSVLLGDIRTAMAGARQEAARLGADVRVVPELLGGEARAAAGRLAVAAASAGTLHRRRAGRKAAVTVFGGETTVTVKGSGTGGRCRELALAAALAIGESGSGHLLVAGTDGVDNLPDAAGAFVEPETLARARRHGLDPRAALDANDSGTFFEALGDSFAPGSTGTHVGDLAFVLRPAGDPADEMPRPDSLPD